MNCVTPQHEPQGQCATGHPVGKT